MAIVNGTDKGETLLGTPDPDTIDGKGANDVIRAQGGADTLIGGTGNDEMYGGTGNDVYYVDSDGDRLIELTDQGIDEVRVSSQIYFLQDGAGGFVENMTVLYAGDFDGFGNSLNNVIRDGVGNDNLHGLLADTDISVTTNSA